MRRAAFNTLAGFMWLPEPRWSPAPHLEGQRWLSAGGRHDWAAAEPLVHSSRATIVTARMRSSWLIQSPGPLAWIEQLAEPGRHVRESYSRRLAELGPQVTA